MHWRLAFISITLVIGTLLALCLAYLGWTRRRSPGAYSFIFMMLAVSIWSFSYALEQFTPVLDEKIFWHKMAYFGIPYVPLCWFVFNAQILDFRFAKRIGWLSVLAIIPIVTTVLTWTLESHEFMWGTLHNADYNGLTYLALVRLPDFYFFVGYSYILLLLGSIMFVRVLFISASLREPMIAGIAFAAALPISFNVLRIGFGIDPFFPYDLTPVALTATGMMSGWFVFRFGPLDILYLARVTLLESMDEGFVVLGTSGLILNINNAAQKMLSTDHVQARGHSLTAILPEGYGYHYADTGEPLTDDLNQITTRPPSAANARPTYREVVVTDVAGVEANRYVEVSASYLFDARNRFNGVLLILRDISQRKEAQQALMQAQRMESTGLLAGGVAHDFNNLLAAITMRHQLAISALQKSALPNALLPSIPPSDSSSTPANAATDMTTNATAESFSETPPSANAAALDTNPAHANPAKASTAARSSTAGGYAQAALRHMKIAGTAVERATDLTRQLLAYTGKGHFKIELLNINELIVENRALLATAVPKNIDLQLRVSPISLYINADRGQLQQVVMNLLLNAVESIDEGYGQIEVQTGHCQIDGQEAATYVWKDEPQPGQYIYLQVSDTGVGMSYDVQSRIFDPFYTTKKDGRGLGLAALLGAIHLYNGGIRVYSTEGQGTTFRAVMPSAVQPFTANQFTQSSYPRHGAGQQGREQSRRETILIVDDEDSVLSVLQEILIDYGLEIYTATNGLAAVECFQAHQDRIDLVLMDAKMPIMGGVESLALIREISPSVSCLLSSGYSEEEISLNVEWNQLTDFIQKPYDVDELVFRIRELLDRRRLYASSTNPPAANHSRTESTVAESAIHSGIPMA